MITRIQIKERVDGLLHTLEVDDYIPLQTEKVACYLGYGVDIFLPDESTRDVTGAVSLSEKMIYLNGESTARKQLFTLAHEIGHIILHSDPKNTDQTFVDYWQPEKNNAKDKEADLFAAELLMPERRFIKSWNHWSGFPCLVAADFAVSTHVAETRARQLSLI